MFRVLSKPCPNCGSTPGLHVYAENMIAYLQLKFQVKCEGCGACTHIHEDEGDAIHEFYVEMDTRPEIFK